MIRDDQYAGLLMTLKSAQKNLELCQSDRQEEFNLRCKLYDELESTREVILEAIDALELAKDNLDVVHTSNSTWRKIERAIRRLRETTDKQKEVENKK